ncbi:murein transglycosylase A [Variovorax sp. HJSM1_2]|uniref:murein transglycosylase A n=1 Tax=Variovorax sp. HJSM1_2 TaxID=3366263 RepID=UPI003BD7BBC4
MVHQTINSSSSSAPSASRRIRPMQLNFQKLWTGAILGMLVAILAGCASAPDKSAASAPPAGSTAPTTTTPGVEVPSYGNLGLSPQHPRSRWLPVDWSELPGFADDNLFEAWNAWIKSCERPGPTFAPLCGDVRRLSLGSNEEQRAWLQQRLQPYRVEPVQGSTEGLLTSYYEPLFDGTRQPSASSAVPLYRPPATLGQRKPWYTRQEMETLPEARAALAGREIIWLSDPVDALVLQIQGSGRIRVTEPDGSQRLVRLAYAGTNDQPYKSVGRWLLDQGLVRDATWPGIKAWIAQNPQRLNELLWSNPRMVFFREEALPPLDAAFGPRGAQGVPLTPGRSIAVDPGSIPYGTPVWLASPGPSMPLQKLVLAQDTGSAITGAVRADYFAGWGPQAGELAGRLKQTLRMWVLWPK